MLDCDKCNGGNKQGFDRELQGKIVQTGGQGNPEETASEAVSLGRAFHTLGTGYAFSQQREEGEEALDAWNEREKDWHGHPGYTIQGAIDPHKDLGFILQAVRNH